MHFNFNDKFENADLFEAIPWACGILVLWPGIEPKYSAVKIQCPNHWTDRQFSHWLFFKISDILLHFYIVKDAEFLEFLTWRLYSKVKLVMVSIHIYKFSFQVEELVLSNVLIIDMSIYGIFGFYCKDFFKQMVFSFAYYCEFCKIILLFPQAYILPIYPFQLIYQTWRKFIEPLINSKTFAI